MADMPVHEQTKLDPKLRMLANGSEEVNTLRAERSPAIAVVDPKILKDTPLLRGPDASPEQVSAKVILKASTGSLDKVFVNVLIELKEGAGKLPEALVRREPDLPPPVYMGNFVAAPVALNDLQGLLADPSVVAIENTEHVRFLPPLHVSRDVGEPKVGTRRVDLPESIDLSDGVLVGIIDVQGFDFSHEEFLDRVGKTRFVEIWDQGGSTRPAPKPFGYGSLIAAEHMNAAIGAAGDIGLPATELEPQSQMVPGSHATHVASIAAGNRGVCPEADIAGVLISLPLEDTDSRKSFYDSSRIMHAVEYLFDLGNARNQPVSINISLGTNGHAHDASSVNSRWIDFALSSAGRSICVAAGNAGQIEPAEPGDWGFVMGRIHTSGVLEKAGDSVEIEWIVLGDGIADLSENELEIWYEPQDWIKFEIRPPGASEWIGPVNPGEYQQNRMLSDGTFISIYNEIYSAANGHNYIACYLSPFLSSERVVGVRAGTWLVRLTAIDIRDGRYHAWIERDDPRRLGKTGFKEAWAFPSFFSRDSTVGDSTVSSLACGQRVVSIANLDDQRKLISITSSRGPTRDERLKPEIAAPGTDIVAASGFGDPNQPWILMSGTSMASPYVAGVVARMLIAEPKLTAAQIGGIVRRTAKPLAGAADFGWENDAGFGEIDPAACMEEVVRLRTRRSLHP